MNDVYLDTAEKKENLPLSISFRRSEGKEGPFLAELTYVSGDVRNQVFIGTGGNIYSWRANGLDLLPPQADQFSRWIDEVFQMVFTRRGEGQRVARGDQPLYVHQAGAYAPLKAAFGRSLAAPALAYEWDSAEKEFYVLSWPQSAHLPTSFKSELIILTRYRRISEAFLEVAHIVLNFGQDTFDWINIPWGGVRSTVFMNLSSIEGKIIQPLGRAFFSKGSSRHMEGTSTALIWSSSPLREDSLGLAILAPSSGENRGSNIRWGIAGGPKNWTRRDFFVGTVIATETFAPGEVLAASYLIGVGKEQAVREQVLSMDTAPIFRKVHYAPAKRAQMRCVTAQNSMRSKTAGEKTCAVKVTLRLEPGSRPLFHAWETVDQREAIITDDLYLDHSGADFNPNERIRFIKDFVGFSRNLIKSRQCPYEMDPKHRKYDVVCFGEPERLR